MLTLGVDLTGPPRALFVDGSGAVTSREQSGSDDALEKAAHDPRVGFVGVAVPEHDPRKVAIVGTNVTRCAPGPAAVAAEVWVGAARGAQHAVCLSIGEQVFAGLWLDGRVWAGAHNRAGDVAWLALNPVERQDYRKLGGLAAEIAFKGIARRLAWRIQAGDHSAVLERVGDLEAITAAHVFDGARAGDGVAISVVRDTARYIGMSIANFAAALDPEVIVVGGAVAAAHDVLSDAVRQECTRRLAPHTMDSVRIEFSTLGDDAVAIGAARLAMIR